MFTFSYIIKYGKIFLQKHDTFAKIIGIIDIYLFTNDELFNGYANILGWYFEYRTDMKYLPILRQLYERELKRRSYVV